MKKYCLGKRTVPALLLSMFLTGQTEAAEIRAAMGWHCLPAGVIFSLDIIRITHAGPICPDW